MDGARLPMKQNFPEKVILHNNLGEWLVTRNFSAPAPRYKKYKKLGWALRYLQISKKDFFERLKLQYL